MGVRNIVSSFLSPVATTLIGWLGGYNATDPRRKILDSAQLLAPQRTTANQLLNGNLSTLRAYCRNLERNNPTARAGIEALTALVVGSGISLEPDTGDEILDGQLRDMFNGWCEKASVSGESIWQLQALGMREMVTAGEGLWRIVYDRDAERMGFLPLRLLPLDAEWIRDDEGTSNDITTVAGVQIDNLGRPVNYLLRNPETDGNPEVVPAKSVIHFYERRRPIQNRGEPWFAPLIETLIQERDLVDAELKAAVSTASLGIAIESEYHDELDTDEYGTANDPVQNLKLGAAVRLFPGEKVNAFSHTRPSQQIAPFRQMLRGDIAAALRIPQRFLDRDVSRANYSSMRADMVDTERILGPVREWYGRGTIGKIYEMLLPYMAAKLGVALPRGDYRLLPDGQAYVDPQKDIAAALLAIDGGLSTHEAEAGKRGGDYRQIWKQLRKEQEQREADGPDITLGAKGSAPSAAAEPVESDDEDEEDDKEDDKEKEMNEADRGRMERMERMVEAIAIARSVPQQAGVTVEQRISMDSETAAIMGRAISEHAKPAEVHVDVAAPNVNVAAPNVRVDSQTIPAPIVNVVNQVKTPSVNVAAPNVTVENEVIVPQRTVVAKPNADGSVTMTPVEE